MVAKQRKRIMIVDDHPMVCQSLEFALRAASGLQVVGTAHNGQVAVDLCPVVQPDIIIMDARMPVMDGIQATRIIHDRYPGTKIIIFTSYDCDPIIQREAFEAGAIECINKQTPLIDFAQWLETL